jgi:hypothetical protein
VCCCPLVTFSLQAIDPELGGSAAASLDAVVAKLARAKAGKGYASAREALLLNGRFVLAQVRFCCCSWLGKSSIEQQLARASGMTGMRDITAAFRQVQWFPYTRWLLPSAHASA